MGTYACVGDWVEVYGYSSLSDYFDAYIKYFKKEKPFPAKYFLTPKQCLDLLLEFEDPHFIDTLRGNTNTYMVYQSLRDLLIFAVKKNLFFKFEPQ